MQLKKFGNNKKVSKKKNNLALTFIWFYQSDFAADEREREKLMFKEMERKYQDNLLKEKQRQELNKIRMKEDLSQ